MREIMKIDLNKKIEEYFENTPLQDITTNSIRNYFPNINVTNEFGGLLHAAVHKRFNEDKVLKFIHTLLANGVSPNIQGERTGYNYIQLALYGYTDKNGDHSYSTEFIAQLIKLGKMYNLDIQASDHDQDSIVHTSLASEVFTGDVIAILDSLGNNFDLKCVDNQGHNIYEALQFYLQEAKNSYNKVWANRLISCSEEIQKRIKQSQSTQEHADLEIQSLKNELSKISQQSSSTLLTTYKDIIAKENQLKLLLKRKFSTTGILEEEHFIETVNQTIEATMMTHLEKTFKHPIKQHLVDCLELATSFQFTSLVSKIKEFSLSYETQIQKLTNELKNANSLFELQGLQPEINKFTEEDVLLEFQKVFDEVALTFTNLITPIESLIYTLHAINLEPENIGVERKDLNKLSLEQLKKEKDLLMEQIHNRKLVITESIQEKTRNLIQELANNIQPEWFTQEEIFNILLETIKQELAPEKNDALSKARKKPNGK